MIRKLHIWTPKQVLAVFGLLRVWIVWYISVILTSRNDIDNILTNIPSVVRFTYKYLLILSTWRLRRNFIPMYYLFVLYRSQQGYFSVEVQSRTFNFSSIHGQTHHTIYLIILITFVEASRWSGREQDDTLQSEEPTLSRGASKNTLELALLLLLRRNYLAVSYKPSRY
jgi:hypothetical protein